MPYVIGVNDAISISDKMCIFLTSSSTTSKSETITLTTLPEESDYEDETIQDQSRQNFHFFNFTEDLYEQ